ncbi:MAG: prepilin peptidase [Acidobacteriaceae bacterium]|jgi:prepilin peptidase CpaA|nr:prepilin peptidase [Acidobacteriaceae bacterium]
MPPVFLMALMTALVACVTDLRSRRIPNVLTFGSALLALLYHGVTDGGYGALMACAGWGAGLGLFLLPFALGGMGGGDIKLLAAAGAWLGPGTAVWLALYTGVAGGVMAIVVALARGYLGTALRNISLLLTHWRVVGVRPLPEITLEESRAPKLAYAIPIFVGTLVTTWLR